MKTYLEFHDQTSDKFWQIEVNAQQHTVTFGKVNSDGQSKTKTFETAEECLKDAEKLIKSKKAKGYAALGETAVIPNKKTPEKKATNAANADDSTSTKSNKQQALDALDQLIRHGKFTDVLTFLQQYAEGNRTALNQAIKQAKRYWCDYQDLSKDPQYINRNRPYSDWGRRGNDHQQNIIHLLAFGLLNESDSKSAWNFSHYLDLYQQEPLYTEILHSLKPDWLGSYLKERAIDNPWAIDYAHLRLLENDQLIQFDPHLYALIVPQLKQYDHKANKITAKSTIEYYSSDEVLVQRDIPLMFEYETRPQDQWFGRWENKIHPWHDIFISLINHNKIERIFAMQKIIEMQSKDWNTQTKSFFKRIFSEINATPEELLQLQEHLFVLLHSEFSATVGFALEQIKLIDQHENFQLEEYLTWLEPLMMRSDLKSQIKTILIQLPNLIKAFPSQLNQILLLLPDVFMQSDLSLQERSAKILIKQHAQAHQEVYDKIALYQDTLLGDLKQQLKSYFTQHATEDELSEQDDFNFSATLERYHYQAPQPDYLNPEQQVQLIDSWENLLFFMGQLPHTQNPLDFDIFMSSWLALRAQRPSDFKTQLDPILKSFSKVQSVATYKTMFQLHFAEYITDQADHWTNNFYHQQINEHKILRCWQELLRYFSNLDLADSHLPLLSLPTHAPSYIEPETLVQRILAYEAEGLYTNFTDIALALARTPRHNTAKAIQLAEQIQGQLLKDVVLFALGASPIPTTIPPSSPELTEPEDIKNWRGLWATVLHTHYPYLELTRINEYDHITVIAPHILPYAYSPHFESLWDNKKGQYIKQQVGQYVKFPLAFYQNSGLSDLYHHQAYSFGQDHYYGWDYSSELANGMLFRHFTPLNTQQTDLHVASNHCQVAESFSEHCANVLTRMMDEDYLLNPYAQFILATHLFAAKKDPRLYAIEAVTQAIYQYKLHVIGLADHLAQLIIHQFAPFSRLIESLFALKDASSLHAHALLQLIEHLIPQLEFTDKLPTQFKKFIELYYLLNMQFSSLISDELRTKLLAWQEQTPSLKPLVKKILSTPH